MFSIFSQFLRGHTHTGREKTRPTATRTTGTRHDLAIKLTQKTDMRINIITEDSRKTIIFFFNVRRLNF